MAAAGARPDILVFDTHFPKPSLIWLLPGPEAPCGKWDIPRTMSGHYTRSPNVVGACAPASSSVGGSTTARTLNLDVSYFLFVSRK